ncbi:MAG TPA: FHA domain-containing protein [Mycobacteriales bacterium]|nr:FHA domain-containing protein [Mycobacteriales bacterium]
MSDAPAGYLSSPGSRTGPDGPAPLRDGLLLGRAAHADVRLDDPSVSREHAVVRRRNSTWTVTDNGSRNGTLLNGTRIPMHADCPLRDGDRLELGGVALSVTMTPQDAEVGDQTTAMSLTGLREARASEGLSHYQLQVVQRLAEPWVRGGEPATNAEIAASLGTPRAVDAVKAALRRAYVKTGLAAMPTHTKRRELCRVAQTRGWV